MATGKVNHLGVVSTSKGYMGAAGGKIGKGLSIPVFFQGGHFGKQFDLDLLDFDQTLPLARQQMVDFFMQVPDLEFRLEIAGEKFMLFQALQNIPVQGGDFALFR